MKPIAAPRRTETTIGVGILFVLAAIAGGVFLRQHRFSPAILSPETIGKVAATPGALHPTGSAPAEPATFPLPPGLVPLSPVESFGPDTLSDKIDGKADLDLVAGFVELVCQRLAAADNRADWLEVYQFDMGNARNAFTVFSNRRRAGAESLDVTPLAYQTANALFFAAGQHYLEIIAGAAELAADQRGWVDGIRLKYNFRSMHTDQMKQAVPIGDVLRYLMYYRSYGDRDRAREFYRRSPAAARRQFGHLDYAAAKRRCPNGLPIARLMREADDLLG